MICTLHQKISELSSPWGWGGWGV